jgi:hypothetical protein
MPIYIYRLLDSELPNLIGKIMKINIVLIEEMKFINMSKVKQSFINKLARQSIGYQLQTDRGIFVKVKDFPLHPFLWRDSFLMVHLDDFNEYEKTYEVLLECVQNYLNSETIE